MKQREQYVGFTKRCTQQLLITQAPMRRKARVMKGLSDKNSDGGVCQNTLRSYEVDESPEKGKSQEAVSNMMLFTMTQERMTTTMTNEHGILYFFFLWVEYLHIHSINLCK